MILDNLYLRELSLLNFVYDSSILTNDGPFWPQTLDYKPPWKCNNCTAESFSGIWQFPVMRIASKNNSDQIFTNKSLLIKVNFNFKSKIKVL